MIQFNEINDTHADKEALKRFLIKEGTSAACAEEITSVLSDEAILSIQQLLVKAINRAKDQCDDDYHKGFLKGKQEGYDEGYNQGHADAMYDAKFSKSSYFD